MIDITQSEVRPTRGSTWRRAALIFSFASSTLVMAGSGRAAVVEYTSQAAFDAAAPTATTFGFSVASAPADSQIITPNGTAVVPNPLLSNGVSFFDAPTLADAANGGEPLLFLISSNDTPTYGQDFLSFQNTDGGGDPSTNGGIQAIINNVGSSAFGFQYGSYISSGPATLTLNTGDTFALSPTNYSQFIGFISTTPITSLSVSFPAPDGYGFDVLSVSSVSAAPEPASWALLMLGVGCAGVALRRHRRADDVAATSFRSKPATF